MVEREKCVCGHTSLRRLRTEQSSSELPITPMISVSLTLTASQDFLSETTADVELRQSRWCWLHFWDTGRKQVWFSTHSFRVWLLKKDLSACTECLGNRGHSKLALLVLTLMYTVIVLNTVEIHRLNQWVLDWTTVLAGEVDREMTCVSFTSCSNGTI